MSNTYDNFALKTKSSKLILCHIEAKQRLSVFTLSSGTIYKKTCNYFVVNVSEDGTDLTNASNSSLSSGEWYFNPLSNELFINSTDNLNPNKHNIVVTYRLFYANRPIDLPFDLNIGAQVNYDGRLISNSPISKQLDEEQIGIV